MSIFQEYASFDAIGLAELVSKRETSPQELLETAITHIENLNPQLNAVIHPMYEEARKVACTHLPEGPFKGVPFLLKDLGVPYAGMPYSKGCKALKGYIAKEDNEIMRRIKSAGLITLGKTATPEFGMAGHTETEAFGITRSPWNLEHTPGGSSGGSAAVVAAGIVPMASGGDAGGSIRNPASYCGIFGLKPSRGRVSRAPEGEVWQGADVVHVLTRSVRDSAAMLDVLSGKAPGDPYITDQSLNFLSATQKIPRKLKIAFSTQSPFPGKFVHPECVQAVEETISLLDQLGHDLIEARPDYDAIALGKAFLCLYFVTAIHEIQEVSKLLGRKMRPRDVESATWTAHLLGKTYSAYEALKAKEKWYTVGRVMGKFHQKYDLYLTPTMAILPPKIGEQHLSKAEYALMSVVNTFGGGRLLRASGIIDKIADENLGASPFAHLANLTGQPAMSVPMHWSKTGLPVGVQFMAPIGDEYSLFQIAAQLELANPWFHRRPEVSVD